MLWIGDFLCFAESGFSCMEHSDGVKYFFAGTFSCRSSKKENRKKIAVFLVHNKKKHRIIYLMMLFCVCRLPGKIRSIGVCNFEVQNLERLLEISKVQPSVVQNSFDPFNQDRATREFCERNNIQYMGHRY